MSSRGPVFEFQRSRLEFQRARLELQRPRLEFQRARLEFQRERLEFQRARLEFQINNLIGEGEILPSASEGSSVTAAPVEIRFESAPGVAASAPAAAESYRVESDLYTVDDFNHLRDRHAKELCSYWEDIFKQEQLDRLQRMTNFQTRKLHAHQAAQKRQRLSSKVGSRSSSSQRVVQQEEQEPAEIAFAIRATKPPNDQDAKPAGVV